MCLWIIPQLIGWLLVSRPVGRRALVLEVDVVVDMNILWWSWWWMAVAVDVMVVRSFSCNDEGSLFLIC